VSPSGALGGVLTWLHTPWQVVADFAELLPATALLLLRPSASGVQRLKLNAMPGFLKISTKSPYILDALDKQFT
jgi:hypothetical protein